MDTILFQLHGLIELQMRIAFLSKSRQDLLVTWNDSWTNEKIVFLNRLSIRV